jgi:hypothetical protein
MGRPGPRPGAAVWWPTGRPSVNARGGGAWSRVWGSARGGRVRGRCARRERRGASSPVRCPEGSQPLDGPGRSSRDAGLGQASSGAGPWRTRTGIATRQRSVFWSSTRASEPRQRPRRMPPPQPKRPSVARSPASAWKPAGWPVPPPPRQPSATLKAAPGKFESKRFCFDNKVITPWHVTFMPISVVLYRKEPCHADSQTALSRWRSPYPRLCPFITICVKIDRQ